MDGLQTWNSADTINGGEGSDTLTAVISADVAPATGAVTGVETIVVTAVGAATVDFGTATTSAISGVTEVKNLASTQALTFADVRSIPVVSVENTAAATVVNLTAAAVAGTADALTLNVNGATGAISVGAGATVPTLASTGPDVITGLGTGIETIIINATGAASAFSAEGITSSATSVTVTGDADLNLSADGIDTGSAADAVFASVGTFDASAATGDITVVFAADAVTGATNTKTLNGGAGDDSFDISAIVNNTVGAVSVNMGLGDDTVILGERGESDWTIAGGAGTDTISVSVDAAFAAHGGISGFERLIATNAVDSTSGSVVNAALDMSQFTNNQTFTTLRAAHTDAATTATTATSTFSNVVATVGTLELAANADSINVTLTRATDGASDALGIVTTANSNVAALSIADEETVTINTADGSLTVNASSSAFVTTDMTSLTVSGDNNATLSVVTSAKIATVDVSGLTDAASFSANFAASTVAMTVTANTASTGYTGALTVTTGSGNDTITGTANGDTITLSSGFNTVNAGAGADTVVSGTGNDTVTLGAGADSFRMNGSFGNDTITDFVAGSAGDKLVFAVHGGTTAQTTTVASSLNSALGSSGANYANKVFIVAKTSANDTASEIAALYTAVTEGTASLTLESIYIAYDSNGVGDVYKVTLTDGAGASDIAASVTALGSIDLNIAWTTILDANVSIIS